MTNNSKDKLATESQYYHCDKCNQFVINPSPKKCPQCKGKLSPATYNQFTGWCNQ
jgi:rubrerythrin